MDNSLYPMIFKRKSFHLFRNIGEENISDHELMEIQEYFTKITPLYPDIEVQLKIVKENKTCKRGQQYIIEMYSQNKPGYLQNIGYMGQQLDLWLVSKNIGTLWFGIGKVDQPMVDDKEYVIMIAIAKVDSADKFRKDMYKSKRYALEDVWLTEELKEVGDIARFSPSACNSQPWRVKGNKENLEVYRFHKNFKVGLMNAQKSIFYNQIDMGIFLCILELTLTNFKYNYKRQLHIEKDSKADWNLQAIYHIK